MSAGIKHDAVRHQCRLVQSFNKLNSSMQWLITIAMCLPCSQQSVFQCHKHVTWQASCGTHCFHHETQFSSQLHVAHYPYVALLSGSNERTKKVASSEGLATPSDIMQMLQPAVEEHGAQFVADQADHNERVSASFLSPFKASMLPLPVCSTHPTRKCCVFNWP